MAWIRVGVVGVGGGGERRGRAETSQGLARHPDADPICRSAVLAPPWQQMTAVLRPQCERHSCAIRLLFGSTAGTDTPGAGRPEFAPLRWVRGTWPARRQRSSGITADLPLNETFLPLSCMPAGSAACQGTTTRLAVPRCQTLRGVAADGQTQARRLIGGAYRTAPRHAFSGELPSER